MLTPLYNRLEVFDKNRSTRPPGGAVYTATRCSLVLLMHRIVVQTTPHSGAVRRVFGLPLHRIVVTFINFTKDTTNSSQRRGSTRNRLTSEDWQTMGQEHRHE